MDGSFTWPRRRSPLRGDVWTAGFGVTGAASSGGIASTGLLPTGTNYDVRAVGSSSGIAGKILGGIWNWSVGFADGRVDDCRRDFAESAGRRRPMVDSTVGPMASASASLFKTDIGRGLCCFWGVQRAASLWTRLCGVCSRFGFWRNPGWCTVYDLVWAWDDTHPFGAVAIATGSFSEHPTPAAGILAGFDCHRIGFVDFAGPSAGYSLPKSFDWGCLSELPLDLFLALLFFRLACLRPRFRHRTRPPTFVAANSLFSTLIGGLIVRNLGGS